MIDGFTDGCKVFFTIPAGNDDLRSNPESPAQHDDGKIVYPANGAGAQLHLTYPSQEGGIGNVEQVLRNAPQDDRVGDLPDITVFYISFKHKKDGAKVGRMCGLKQKIVQKLKL